MSKQGRQRRTLEQKIKAREDRSSLALLARLYREAGIEKLAEASAAMSKFGAVSETAAAAIKTLGDQLGIAPDEIAHNEFAETVSKFTEAQ